MRRTSRSAGMALVCAAVAYGHAAGQSVADSAASMESWWLKGFSVGVPGVRTHVEPSFFTVAYHASYVPDGGFGVETFFGTMPRAAVEGVVVLGARGNLVAVMRSSGGFVLLPTAGVSFIGGVGGGGGGAETGVNAGIGFMSLHEPSRGIRAGVTWHAFGQGANGIWLLEFGFVRG